MVSKEGFEVFQTNIWADLILKDKLFHKLRLTANNRSPLLFRLVLGACKNSLLFDPSVLEVEWP